MFQPACVAFCPTGNFQLSALNCGHQLELSFVHESWGLIRGSSWELPVGPGWPLARLSYPLYHPVLGAPVHPVWHLSGLLLGQGGVPPKCVSPWQAGTWAVAADWGGAAACSP